MGGAKLADGLQRQPGTSLSVVVNTGDDFELHGLYISPDIDTVIYNLAGIANPQTGWGIANDTLNTLQMLAYYSHDTWFQLGDRDLATHITRTHMLRQGYDLTTVTGYLAKALSVRANILPMTNGRVATVIVTDAGEMPFQEYFVHRGWQPVVRAIRFEGLPTAMMTDETAQALELANAIIICPSNPFLSVDPILSVHGLKDRMLRSRIPKVAVSPIVGGEALKGPAAKIFRELGVQPSAHSVAMHYRGLIDRFVIDHADAAQAPAIRDLGMRVWVTNTVMRMEADRERLAREILDWVAH